MNNFHLLRITMYITFKNLKAIAEQLCNNEAEYT